MGDLMIYICTCCLFLADVFLCRSKTVQLHCVALLLLAVGVFWGADFVVGALHTIFWLLQHFRT
jgi:membrane protein CcdC involved in cytochrome C biogenesis